MFYTNRQETLNRQDNNLLLVPDLKDDTYGELITTWLALLITSCTWAFNDFHDSIIPNWIPVFNQLKP